MTQLNQLNTNLVTPISDHEAAVLQGGLWYPGRSLVNGIVGEIKRRRERCNNRPSPTPSPGRTPGPQESPHQF